MLYPGLAFNWDAQLPVHLVKALSAPIYFPSAKQANDIIDWIKSSGRDRDRMRFFQEDVFEQGELSIVRTAAISTLDTSEGSLAITMFVLPEKYGFFSLDLSLNTI